MPNTVQFELVSPQKLIKSIGVEMAVVPGTEGDLGVLPGHTPLIAILRPGMIHIYENEKVVEKFFVSSGFCEVSPERCIVLGEEIIEEKDLDPTEAKSRLSKAKSALTETVAHAENFREVQKAKKNVEVAKSLLFAITSNNNDP